MSYRPSESLKSVATELAELIFNENEDQRRIAALMAELHTGESKQEQEIPALVTSPPATTQDTLGIWKLTTVDGEPVYEKNVEVKYEWTIWADVPQIPVKKTKKRIILIGESVARGFFYDPYYTVAMEMDATLKKTTDLSGCEVVDLARCGLNMEQLLELSASCTVLDPDAVVFLAGNNWWINNFMDDADYRHMTELLRQDRIREIKAFIEVKFAARITDMLAELKKTLVDKGIAVVFAIPAFNLKDWKSDDILAGNHLVEWANARQAAEQALAKGEWEAYGTAAGKMIDTDPSNPIGYEYMTDFHIRNNRKREAIKNLELARDTALYCRANNTPRCFAIIEKTISEQAGKFGIEVVNLQEMFRSMPDAIADRTMFLDYCHLTIKGIKMAMRHIVKGLIKAMFDKELPVEEIIESDHIVDRDIESIAHFCAATHNGHYGQRAELIMYHALQAVGHSDAVKSVMQKAIDFSSRRATTSLCAAFEEIILERNVQQYERGATFFHPKNGKMMDVNLVNANVKALQMLGIDIAAKVDELRRKEHGIGDERVNLLQAFYCRKTYASPIVTVNTNFFQVRSNVTNFYFVIKDDQPLHFELTYRAPRASGVSGNIQIAVNSRENVIAGFPVATKWTKKEFTLTEGFHPGINELYLIWPCYDAPASVAKYTKPSIVYLEKMFPVLGEIHSFTCRIPVAQDSPAVPVHKDSVPSGLSAVLE